MKSKRIDEMEKYIRRKKHVTLDELCEVFDVSKNTVRKDVSEIIEQESFEKVYGGVEFIETFMPPFEERHVQSQEGKKEIAERAAQEIKAHDIIYIDSGTTTQYIPEYLREDMPLTIITNSLIVINKAASMPNAKVIVVGENYRRNTHSFNGVTASGILEMYNIHKAFMAASALSMRAGLSNSDSQEYEIKHGVVSKARKKYILISHEKIGTSSLVTYAKLEDMDVIISDRKLPEEYQKFAEQKNIKVLLPK